MKRSNLLTGLFLTSAAVLAGTTHAATYESAVAGSWATASNWRVGGQIPNSAPGPNDDVIITHAMVVDSGTQSAKTVTINTSGSLDVQATLSIVGSGTTVTLAAGDITLSQTGSVLKFTTNNQTIAGTSGKIVGQQSAAELRVAGGVSLTVTRPIEGAMKFVREGASGTATLVNQSTIEAKLAGKAIEFADSITLSDTSSAIWKVSSDDTAVMKFGTTATGTPGKLLGTIRVEGGGDIVFVSGHNVHVAALVYNQGFFDFPASPPTFTFDAVSGSCGTLPSSPLSSDWPTSGGCP